MPKMNFFQGLLESLFSKKITKSNFNFIFDKKKITSLENLIKNVADAKGEVSAINHSEELLEFIDRNDDKTLKNFFFILLENYDLDKDLLNDAVKNYDSKNRTDFYFKITKFSEPKRLEIFRRLNASTRGTIRLVNLRKRLKTITKNFPILKIIDHDLINLFKNWFNRGFLIIRPIDWATPAHILEKIIEYEAVHEINSWDELRRRLAPNDRKCYGFFHPAMEDEPLIFIEVALMNTIPEKISEVLKNEREFVDVENVSVAVFYSISNCQIGLAGISFGNFLIKQVANDLKFEFPSLKSFVTLSPVPGFTNWLKKFDEQFYKKITKNINVKSITNNQKQIMGNSLKYFFRSNRKDNLPNDPVSRFHIGNGAVLEKINFMGNESEKALNESLGLMVNYLYDINNVEKNHEKFVLDKELNASKNLIKQFSKLENI